MLQFFVDNYGFLADHALPQYFTIIILLLLFFLYFIYIYMYIYIFSLRSKQNFFYDSVDGVR